MFGIGVMRNERRDEPSVVAARRDIIFRVPQLVRVLLHFSVHLVGNDEERSGGPDRHTNSDRGRL